MYTDRLAVIHPTIPTITVSLYGATYPRPRLYQFRGHGGIDVPPQSPFDVSAPMFFVQGMRTESAGTNISDWHTFANYPVIMADANPTDSTMSVLAGINLYGFAPQSGEYAIREAGTVSGDIGQYFAAGVTSVNSGVNAFIDGCYFGYRPASFDIVTWPDLVYGVGDSFGIEYAVQSLGTNFTGGVIAPVSLNAVQTGFVDPGFGAAVGLLNDHEDLFVSPSLASSLSAPEALYWYQVGFDGSGSASAGLDDSRVLGFKIAADGTVTDGIGMFLCGADTHVVNCNGIHAVCLGSGSTYHVLRNANGNGSPIHTVAYTTCQEAAPGAEVYTNYRAGFTHAELPTYLEDIVFGSTGSYSADYFLVSMTGTDAGFLITYKKKNGSTWDPKYLLVSKDWATFQFVVPSPQDSIATAIVTQGSDTVAALDSGSFVNMFLQNGVYFLLGGTTIIPKLATSIAAGGEDPGVVDEDLRVRVWGYSLDDHDKFVLRLGASGTLVYDLKTGQWAEWASPAEDVWTAHVGQNWVGIGAATFERGFKTDVVAGDDQYGVLYLLDPTAGQDDDPVDGQPQPFNRVVMGGLPLDGREVARCNAVTLNLSLGNPALTGASITLETSDDMGQNYVDHGPITIVAGDYGAVVEWRSLGQMRAPGRIFRLTDNGAAVRISCADLR